MDDRVGEVLAERASLGRGAAAGIAVSVVLHAALTAAGIVAALHSKPVRTTDVINIQFARMPRAAPAIQPAQAAEAAVPTPAPKIMEPAPEVAKPAAKPEPKTVAQSPFGQSSKKGSEHPVAPPATPAVPVTQTIPAGGTGATVDADFPYSIYIDRMKTLVGTHWFRPQITGAMTTTVYFAIDRDGTIRDAKTETPSGNGTFDRAALRAVLEASPLPPLPFGYNGSWLGVHLTFR